MSEKWTNYTLRGYSDHDGLGAGCWVPVPGSAGIQRWVGDLEPNIRPKRIRRSGECIECQAPIDQRSTRCRSCQGRASSEKRWPNVGQVA